MTNTSTNAIIIDRKAFITNFLEETVFFLLREAKGNKLTCKTDRTRVGQKSILQLQDRAFFFPNDSTLPAVNNDLQDDGASLEQEPESNRGLSMTTSRLWARRVSVKDTVLPIWGVRVTGERSHTYKLWWCSYLWSRFQDSRLYCSPLFGSYIYSTHTDMKSRRPGVFTVWLSAGCRNACSSP